MSTILVKVKGGPGSGNYGHTGRPGLVGGSGGSGGIMLGTGVANYDLHHPSVQKANDLLTANIIIPPSEFQIEQNIRHGIAADEEDAIAKLSKVHIIDDWRRVDGTDRMLVKKELIDELADRTGIDPEDIGNFIAQWAKSSNDTDMRSLSIQRDAAEELGLELSEWQQGKYDKLASARNSDYAEYVESHQAASSWSDAQLIPQDEYYTASMTHNFQNAKLKQLLPPDTQRTLIRAMYDNTQTQLAAQGFKPDDVVQLYRGTGVATGIDFDWEEGSTVHYQGNSIESWSISMDVADGFSGRVSEGNGYTLAMEVPVRNIIGTARSGFGCLTEGEYVIAGNVPNQQAEIAAMFDVD